MGGGTPAALGADWLTSAYDQVAYALGVLAVRGAARAGVDRLAAAAVRAARRSFGGVLTSGATMAQLRGAGRARHWWAERARRRCRRATACPALPAPPILTSGYMHPSAVQAIGMLGPGPGERSERLARDAVGRLDARGDGGARSRSWTAPAIVIANAGEVNAGDFDPIARDGASSRAEHGAWLHVDGAFGLFARLAPRTRHLARGVERADSVIADGHKWLNVPYDCGFAFVRDAARLARGRSTSARRYLPSPDDPHPNFGFLAPENSRRARSLAVWATLRAYGRDRVSRDGRAPHSRSPRHLAERVDAERPSSSGWPRCSSTSSASAPGRRACRTSRARRPQPRLGEALLADGRVFAGHDRSTRARSRFRPAIVNWRTETARRRPARRRRA